MGFDEPQTQVLHRAHSGGKTLVIDAMVNQNQARKFEVASQGSSVSLCDAKLQLSLEAENQFCSGIKTRV
jgi:hypothetical protein